MIIDFDILSRHIEKIMPLQKWGFTESVRFTTCFADTYFNENAKFTQGWDFAIIYNSPYCRVKFYVSPERDQESDFYIFYARLHAPDNEATMMWRGEECHCWYRQIYSAMLFFEGYSPQEAVANKIPQLYKDNYTSIMEKNANMLEKTLGLHVLIWETHGERLFELFDLRHPSLWERYMVFLKEYSMISYRNNPPLNSYQYC